MAPQHYCIDLASGVGAILTHLLRGHPIPADRLPKYLLPQSLGQTSLETGHAESRRTAIL